MLSGDARRVRRALCLPGGRACDTMLPQREVKVSCVRMVCQSSCVRKGWVAMQPFRLRLKSEHVAPTLEAHAVQVRAVRARAVQAHDLQVACDRL